MKRTMTLLLALLVCLSGTALAAMEGPLFEARLIHNLDLDCNYFTYNNAPGPIGIVTREGTPLFDPTYDLIDDVHNGYCEVLNENGLDTHGLIDLKGDLVIPMQYSAFRTFGANWAGAIMLEPTEDEKADYASGFVGMGDHFNITRVDIYHMPEAKLIGSLTRSEFSAARAVCGGEYLLVRDRNDGLTLYNAAFEKVDHLYERYTNADVLLYRPTDTEPYRLCSRVTGQPVSEEVPEGVHSVEDHPDYAEIYKHVDGDSRSALMKYDGTLLCDYVLGQVDSIVDDRFVISYTFDDVGRHYGVYDLQEQRVAVPFAYSAAPKGPYNGYFLVEQDGRQGYVDLQGNVTCPVQYARDDVLQRLGCTLILKDRRMVAADGTVTPLNVADMNYISKDADGQFLPVQNAEGKHGVIDWHGAQIVDFTLDRIPEIHKDGYMLYNNAIYHLTR